jgi:hypothetical protein
MITYNNVNSMKIFMNYLCSIYGHSCLFFNMNYHELNINFS